MAATADLQMIITNVTAGNDHTFNNRIRKWWITCAATTDIVSQASGGGTWRPGAGTFGPFVDPNYANKKITISTANATVVEELGLGN